MWKDQVRLSIINKWAHLKRKSVPKDHCRIEWKCLCGHDLYADFPNISKSRLDEYAAILRGTTNPNSENNTPQTPASGLQIPPAAPIQPGIPLNLTDLRTNHLQDSAPLGSQPAIAASSGGTPSSSFLELCVNTGAHLKTLGEIDLTNVSTDGVLFRAIRERYIALRGFRSKLWLLKPTTVSFVRVRLNNPSIFIPKTN